jgi:hypothetical protein
MRQKKNPGAFSDSIETENAVAALPAGGTINAGQAQYSLTQCSLTQCSLTQCSLTQCSLSEPSENR